MSMLQKKKKNSKVIKMSASFFIYLSRVFYPSVFLFVPIMQIPLVNGLVVKVATGLVVKFPIYLLRYSCNKIHSIVWEKEKNAPLFVENTDDEHENSKFKNVYVLEQDENYPNWMVIDEL